MSTHYYASSIINHNIAPFMLSGRLIKTYNLVTTYLVQINNITPKTSQTKSQKNIPINIIEKFSGLLTTCSNSSIIWRTNIEESKRVLLKMNNLVKTKNISNDNITALEKELQRLGELMGQEKNHLIELEKKFCELDYLINQGKKSDLSYDRFDLGYPLEFNFQEHIRNIFRGLKNQNDLDSLNQDISNCLKEHEKFLVELDLFDETIIFYEKEYVEKLAKIQSKMERAVTIGNVCIVQ
jgi:hypothetical protein